MNGAVLEFAGVSKDSGGLRPLRIADLRVAAGDRVAILGLDQPSAETFVNLATGATLPETGSVRLFDRPTTEIRDRPTGWPPWTASASSASARCCSMPSASSRTWRCPSPWAIEPPPDEVRERAERLAREVGLPEEVRGQGQSPNWTPPACCACASAVGIALNPAVLLLEHASARLARDDVAGVGAGIRAVAAARGIALVAADRR